MIKDMLFVGLGGGIGSMLRFGLSFYFRNYTFPYTTMLINITGSFLIGIILAFSIRSGDQNNGIRLFLATGFCGGFTTFSAFSFENLVLLQNGKLPVAAIYIIASVMLSLLAVYVGFKIIVK